MENSTGHGEGSTSRSAGYSEQRFMAEQRSVTLRRQIIELLAGVFLQVP